MSSGSALAPSANRRARRRPLFSKEPLPRLWKALLLVAAVLVVAGSLAALAFPPPVPEKQTPSGENSNAVVKVPEFALAPWVGVATMLLGMVVVVRRIGRG